MKNYFKQHEFACNCKRDTCDKSIGVTADLHRLLNLIREDKGGPVSLTNAYRCPEHNEDVGGFPNSFHTQQCAADIACSSEQEVEYIATLARKHGAKGIGKYHRRLFVHIDLGVRDGKPDGYVATWTKD